MTLVHFVLLFIFIFHQCLAGPLEDLANMPDLTLFYQQLIRHQDIQMLLQGLFPQQIAGGMNDFTIFAPTNEAMTRLTGKNEDLNLLWKYHIVPGRYDEQVLGNFAQEKLNQASPRQMTGIRPQNNLPTIAVPFQVFVSLGFYGGIGPQVNDTYDNAGYGAGGISWLTQTSLNRTNFIETINQRNPQMMNNYNPNVIPRNFNYTNNINSQFAKNFNNINYNPYLQQQTNDPISPYGSIGVLRPTVNNAFVLQSRLMSRGIINVIDDILWPPERRDQTQYKTAYDVLDEAQFSRLRQLADRSDYFRTELRSIHHQTWFLPNDQAFASIGSSLSFLLDQTSMNNTNEINEFVGSHVIPLVIFPDAMDSTKQLVTSNGEKWITFRKISYQDQKFQIDVISGRHVARILISRPEEIRFYANGIVCPISTILYTPTRSAADELFRNYQYFMALVQQSGDLELLNILQSSSTPNMFNPQNSFNITVLIPQQTSIQQLGTGQELSMNLRRHILRFPIFTDQSFPAQRTVHQTPQQQPTLNSQQNVYQPNRQQPLNPQQNAFQNNQQQNLYQTGQQQQQQPINPQQNFYQTNQQQPINPQQNVYQPNRQQPLNPQQNTFQNNQQQPINSQQNVYQPNRQQPLNPQQTAFQNNQQQPINSQQNVYQPNRQQPLNPQQNAFQNNQQQQQQINPQQNFYQTSQQAYHRQQQAPIMQQNFNQQQQQFQRTVSGGDQKQSRHRRQMNLPANSNFQAAQFPQQRQPLPNQQILFNQQPQQQLPNQPILPTQQQVPLPNQQILPTQQQQVPLPNQQILPTQQQQQVPLPNQQILLTQQQVLLPNQQQPFNPMASYSSLGVFQNGQIYPTLDPQFNVQAQILPGPNGNIVTLIGQSTNSLRFSAMILNSESNIEVKNGVMHVIRGILSGTVLPIEGVLSLVQGASAFTQLLQQTGVINQLRQSNRPYTLFVPTNTALQSIGMVNNINYLRQFVLRHICADILLDPTSNTLRRSSGFYKDGLKFRQKISRQKRQAWQNNPQNISYASNRQGFAPSNNLGPGYFQTQQQVYGGHPAAPTPYGSNNQLYNPLNPNTNYNSMGIPNNTMNTPFNQEQNFGNYLSGVTYTRGPQSCMAMTGERITVQSLGGTQPEGNTPSMSYQNYMVTCCGDQSVNSLVQSFNIYPPNFAVYLIGRTLLSQGQTINTMYNSTCQFHYSFLMIVFFILLIIFKQIQQF